MRALSLSPTLEREDDELTPSHGPRPRADSGKDVFLFDGIKKDSNDKEYYYEEFCYKQFNFKQHDSDGASLSRSLALADEPR